MLSDGCVVSRSDEAKALGIKMSQPFFQLREHVRSHGLVMCSSNFALYADLSQRVATVLRDMAPRCEQYSMSASWGSMASWATSMLLAARFAAAFSRKWALGFGEQRNQKPT